MAQARLSTVAYTNKGIYSPDEHRAVKASECEEEQDETGDKKQRQGVDR